MDENITSEFVIGERFPSFPTDIEEILGQSENQEKKLSYDYPFPEDVNAEFRKKCRDRFKTILTYC